MNYTELFNGSLSTGETSFNYGNYRGYIVIGQVVNNDPLLSLYIPKNVSSIGVYAFHGCVDVLDPTADCGLEFIEVDPENTTYYNDEYGVLYCNDYSYFSGSTWGKGKAIIQYPVANNRKAYYIPDDVVTIAIYSM